MILHLQLKLEFTSPANKSSIILLKINDTIFRINFPFQPACHFSVKERFEVF